MSTVLLLHAGIADSRMWQPQIEVLEGAGHRVVAPDLRGFGEHRLEPAPFSYVRDAEAALDGPAAVVGCSLGGRVALELAVHRPDLVERLVLIAPGFPGWEWAEATRASWAAEEAAYEARDLETAAEESVRLWVDSPEVRCPTLVLVGDHDVADMQAIAAHVAESIEGARLVTVAGASHLPSLERPDEVNVLLLGFLGGT